MDLHRPRKGSRGFRPRKRAETQVAEMFWPSREESRVLGFAGYKVGMTTVAYMDQAGTTTKGQELVGAGTVLEAPPVYVYGVRGYKARKILGETLSADEAKLKLLGMKKTKKTELKEDELDDVRLLVFTQPSRTLIGKKHPERFELALGGKTAKDKLAFAKTLLGKELRAKDVFKPGEIIDVVAITKGKGWQGTVKRFGTSIQRPKATGKRRHVGTLGQWHPAYVLYTAPQAGQTGYHKRTELNKHILKISENVDEINPSGGFPHYGFVKNDFVIVKGSVPGPTKRLVKMRVSARDNGPYQELKLTYLSNEPKQ
ncbi:MAG: 50S ribosomal protein L3 [Candidatus Micrarchaeia archaeon]